MEIDDRKLSEARKLEKLRVYMDRNKIGDPPGTPPKPSGLIRLGKPYRRPGAKLDPDQERVLERTLKTWRGFS